MRVDHLNTGFLPVDATWWVALTGIRLLLLALASQTEASDQADKKQQVSTDHTANDNPGDRTA